MTQLLLYHPPLSLSPNTVARLIGAPPGYIGKLLRVSVWFACLSVCMYVQARVSVFECAGHDSNLLQRLTFSHFSPLFLIFLLFSSQATTKAGSSPRPSAASLTAWCCSMKWRKRTWYVLYIDCVSIPRLALYFPFKVRSFIFDLQPLPLPFPHHRACSTFCCKSWTTAG